MNDSAAQGDASAPKARRKHLFHLLLSVVISAVIIFLIIHNLDWQVLLTELMRLHVAYVPALIAMLLALAWVRAMRWRVLLPQSSSIRTATVFQATVAGFAATFILPLRAGELVRPWLLGRWQKIPFGVALASVVVERFFDVLTLMVLLSVCLMRYQHAPPIVVAGARMVSVTFLVLLVVVVLCYVRPTWVTGAVDAIGRRLLGSRPRLAAKLTEAARGVVAGFRGISSLAELATALGLSAALWLLMAAWYQLLLLAFGVSESFWTGMLLNVMVTVAVAVPSAPGFVGTFQAGCLLALSVMLPHSREFATAYSIVAHALQLGVTVLAGLVILHFRGITVGEMRRQPEALSGQAGDGEGHDGGRTGGSAAP